MSLLAGYGKALIMAAMSACVLRPVSRLNGVGSSGRVRLPGKCARVIGLCLVCGFWVS